MEKRGWIGSPLSELRVIVSTANPGRCPRLSWLRTLGPHEGGRGAVLGLDLLRCEDKLGGKAHEFSSSTFAAGAGAAV